MTIDTDKLFRRVWLTNGFLFLGTILFVLGAVVVITVNEYWNGREEGVRAAAPVAPGATIRPRAVRYEAPLEVLGTPVRLIKITYGTGYADPAMLDGVGAMALSSPRYRPSGAVVNVAFLPPSGPGRLLLDRPAYIRDIHYPVAHRRWSEEEIDTVPWITYEIAFEDTDGSGQLGWEDARGLYISDLDGTHFRSVLPHGFQLADVERSGPDQLLVLATRPSADPSARSLQSPQRAFLYRPSTGKLEPQGVLDSLSDLAGRIVGERVAEGGGPR